MWSTIIPRVEELACGKLPVTLYSLCCSLLTPCCYDIISTHIVTTRNLFVNYLLCSHRSHRRSPARFPSTPCCYDIISTHIVTKWNLFANYRISGIFRLGLIFAEFATSLKSPKIDTAKNKPYYTSSLRVLEIAKIELSENLTHLPSGIFAKISRREKFPMYGTFCAAIEVIDAVQRGFHADVDVVLDGPHGLYGLLH